MELDWDSHHRAHARVVAFFIEPLQIDHLLSASHMAQMQEHYISIANWIYKEKVNQDALEQFDYDPEKEIVKDQAFWAFIYECRQELNATGAYYDSVGLADIAIKVENLIH